VSDIKNPFESLQNYFDELLPSEESVFVAKPTSYVPEKVIQKPSVRTPPVTRVAATKSAAKSKALYAEPDAIKKEQLQKLLHSAQPKIVVAPVVKVAIAPPVIAAPKATFVADPNEIQEWVIETAEPVVETQLAVEAITTTENFTQHYQIPGLEWMPNGLPQWAQSRFDVLLFKVSGLTLAVPLISLGQIQPLTDDLTPLFGQADWFMGLQPTPQGKIRTVNTAKFVMPERYDENFVKNAKYVVSINGVPWGLAVDSVNQPISLMPDEVKWRTDRSKRPWLAGTVKEHMCALLDIPRIGQILIDADKNAMKTHV